MRQSIHKILLQVHAQRLTPLAWAALSLYVSRGCSYRDYQLEDTADISLGYGSYRASAVVG